MGQKKTELLKEHIAYHDQLTGLPNRYLFHDRLSDALALAKQNNQKLAILFLNLNRFKVINDSMGHEMGDQLLKEISERLKECLSEKDTLARYAGDEFICLLPDLEKEEVEQFAKKLLDVLSCPVPLNQYELFITPSIGISLYPSDGQTIEELVKHADSAMYYVKNHGKNNYKFYHSNLDSSLHEQLELEMNLYKALERSELTLHYQPQIELSSGKMIGTEALIRWEHPQKGIITPTEFIPIAEETGLIIPIGEWVLRSACSQNKAWQNAGLPPMVVSVNLSARQFYQSNLVEVISQILRETELEAQYLELEITESIAMGANRTISTLTKLKELGVKISLDDFGTGYSSLHYLKRFPLDRLKIDQSFVRECMVDSNDATIVKTIISMAHNMKLKVIAEGVETKEQLTFLQQHLCNEAQGFFFSQPLTVHELEEKYIEIQDVVMNYGIPQDETKRMWMEEALRMAHQDLEDTVHQQQGMTLKFKKQDGRFIHTLCDGELLYRMGLTPEQVIGKELSDFLPAEIAAVKTNYFRRVWEGEENVTYEGEVNGISYFTSLRAIKRGEQIVEVIGSCVDISERKRIEEALRQSEAKYRLIAENMSDLIGVLDLNGVIKYVSPSCQSILGYTSEALEGKNVFKLIYRDDVDHVKKQFSNLKHTKSLNQITFRLNKVNETSIFVEAKGTYVMAEDGEKEHIVFVARDITEKKKAEENLRKSDRLSIVGELAAGVAHEIRNPITSIKGFVQLLQLGRNRPEYYEIMLSEFSRLELIIQEFLTLAKPQADGFILTNLGMILQNVNALLQPQANLNNVQLVLELEPDLPLIRCNENHMKQVFINLVKNAIEAMPQGGNIIIQVKVKNSKQVDVRIIDQGCGMSEERLAKLGEPFYSTKEKGTGLGLMISFKIIKDHQGEILIHSEMDKGTTVEVILPIS